MEIPELHNLLLTYGCSHGLLDQDGKGNFNSAEGPFHWMGKHLMRKLINRSKAGSGNEGILKKIIQDFQKFTINNIVIVQWSYINRKTRVHGQTLSETITPLVRDNVANIYYKHIYNETDEANLILIYSLFLESSFPSKFYFSFVDGETCIQKSADPIILRHFNNKCKNITVTKQSLSVEFANMDKKKYLLPDCHLNAEGAKLLSNLYLDKIISAL
jgi:hypothetical protein